MVGPLAFETVRASTKLNEGEFHPMPEVKMNPGGYRLSCFLSGDIFD